MNPILDEIASSGVVPRVTPDGQTDGGSLVAALVAGGLPIVEILLTGPGAIDVLRAAATASGDAVVGVVGVTGPRQVDDVVEAGARFACSAGLDEATLAQARARGLPLVPACATPAEVRRAAVLGLDVVRVSPAGAEALTTMLASFEADGPGVRYWLAAGATRSTLGRCLADHRVLAVSADWVAPPEPVSARDWAAVTALACDARRAAHGFGVVHVGVSTAGGTEADAVAGTFAALFGFDVQAGNSSNFASRGIEVMKGRSRGQLGHIAIGTSNIERAIEHLSRRGVAFVPASEKYSPDGRLKAVYLVEEVAGFALHLMQVDGATITGTPAVSRTEGAAW